MRRRNKNTNKIIIFSVLGIFCLFTVGYATFSSDFLVSGKGTIIEKQTAAQQLMAKAVTSGDGLYEDSYEEGRYVYKGASPDNYITFSGETWRIISVESDGTIKIMRNSSVGTRAFDSTGLRDSGSSDAGGTYCVQFTVGCNAWAVSDNFVSGSYSGTVLMDAEINTYLNSTYKNTLTDVSYIQEHNFGVGIVTYDNTDLEEQIESENSTTWYGSIGLMSVSDYIRTNTNTTSCENLSLNNSNSSTCKNTTWIQDVVNSSTHGWIWTTNPYADSYGDVFYVNDGGDVDGGFAGTGTGGFAPVLYLKSNITLSGSGTDLDPYTID